MVRGVASVRAYVRDTDASADFHRRLLGAEPTDRDPTALTFHTGALRLIPHRDKQPPHAGLGAMEFTLRVPAAACTRALTKRGSAADAPVRMPWGWTGFIVTDPDGDAVAIDQPPEAAPSG